MQGFEVREFAFKWNTCVGTDHFQLSWVVMDDSLLQGVVDPIKWVEDTAKLPEHASFLSFLLLPNPAGGFRTVAVLPTLIRVWEASRVDAFRDWIRKHQR